MTYNT